MSIKRTQKTSNRPKAAPAGGYKTVGTLSDGVTILAPKNKPKHFTDTQISRTIRKIRSRSAGGTSP